MNSDLEIKSFHCKLLITGNEAFLAEPSPLLFSFFGTSEETYKDGIVSYITHSSYKENSVAIQEAIELHVPKGEDFHLVYLAKRGTDSLHTVQLDWYAGDSSGNGRFYDVIGVDVSTIVAEEKARNDSSDKADQKLLNTINNLPNNSVLFRIVNDKSLIPERYSEEYCRMRGYSTTDNVYRENAFGGVHPQDAVWLMKFIQLHLKDEEPFHAVYRIITKSKSWKWVSVNFNSFTAGDTKYLYAQYTDIDELKKQEQLLEEQYRSAQAFFDSVSNSYLATRRTNITENRVESVKGINALSKVRLFTNYDESIKALLDYIPKESDKKACEEFYSRETLAQAYREGNTNLSRDFQIFSPQGDLHWVHAIVILSKRPGSDDIIAFSAMSDISKEKMVEQIMNHIVTDQYDYIACIQAERNQIDMVTVKEQYSKTFYSSLNYEETMRKAIEEYVVSEDKERCKQFMLCSSIVEALEKEDKYATSYAINENGEVRNKRIEFFYIDKESKIIAVLRSDYSEIQKQQIEQEEVLRKALKDAQQASVAKTEFLSRMSHDIRTPINGIIGMTYIANEQNNPPETKHCLEKIDTSSKFLLGLINDILDMSKAESGKIELHPEPYLMSGFDNYIESVIKPLCEVKHQTFTMKTKSVQSVIPIVDILRFNQIIFNLLSNAVKYTPEKGKIKLEILNELVENHKERVTTIVSDNGIGMTEEFQKVLFNPFTQEKRSDTSDNRGSGLGLSIVKKMIEIMGGTIDVKSKLGEGSKFTVVVDFDYIEADQATWNTKENNIGMDHSILAGKHVLLCEDHPLNQEIAKTLLEEKKMIVDIEENGQKGVEHFARSAVGFYDLVLMDIRMPVMDGYEATKQIRNLNRADAKKVPIIAMTADAFETDVKKCLDAGMNEHIAKPIEPETLYQVLSVSLAVSSQEGLS